MKISIDCDAPVMLGLVLIPLPLAKAPPRPSERPTIVTNATSVTSDELPPSRSSMHVAPVVPLRESA